MKKLVITDWNTLSMTDDLSTAALQELADVTAYPLTAPEEAAARIGDAELLLCNKTPITAAVLDACPNLEYIGVMATGYNNIDLKAAAQHGITVSTAAHATCGVIVQFGSCRNGVWSDIGSVSRTSTAAPAMTPLRNASANAVSSTMPPRAVLMRNAVGFILASRSALTRCCVSGVNGV